MIFVEKDMFMIICSLIVIVLIAVIIIGVVHAKKKSLKEAPLYTVNSFFLPPLQQVVLQTDPVFQMELTLQDELLKREYPVGKDVTLSDGTQAKVSRLRKRILEKGAVVSYLYTIYLAPYEYVEFPRVLTILNNEYVDTIDLDKENVKFLKDGTVILQRKWNNCFFSNMNNRIRICHALNGISKLDFTLEKGFFTSDEEYYFLEEILMKYAVLSN